MPAPQVAPLNTTVIHLPPEIVDKIASQLSHGSDSTEAMQQCILVSRSFRDHFQPLLFSYVSLSDGIRGAEELAAKSQRKASLFYQTISQRPDLAQHVKTLGLVLGTECQNETIPRILGSLPYVARFIIYGVSQAARWTQLTPSMKTAITTITRLPSLRSFKVTGFPTISATLLRANCHLDELVVANVGIICVDEPNSDFGEPPATEIPTAYFTSVRDLTSIHLPILGKQHWLLAAVEGASTSGMLRSLSIMPIFMKPPGFEIGETPFGEPVDLSGASSLSILHLRCTDGSESSDGTAELIFGAFCQYISSTLATVKEDSVLAKLELHYVSRKSHERLLETSFWDVPAWNDLSAIVGNAKSRKPEKLQEVSLALEFDRIPEDEQALASSTIKGLVLQSAPNLSVTVSFDSPYSPDE